MCEHDPNREAAMVTVRPGVWCDPCLAPLIAALNDGGQSTIASCCGHGHRPGTVILADGRELLVLPNQDWVDFLTAAIHARVGCKPGHECSNCAAARGLTA